VTLEILDSRGKALRRYASNDEPEIEDSDLKALAIPPYWVRMPHVLSASAGLHRWVWDLHGTPPESLRHGYPIAAVPHNTPRLPLGPRVLPGQYTIRLTVEGRTYSAPLTVKMDPRVKTTPAGLQQQYESEQQLVRIISRTTEAIWQIRSAQEQIEKLAHDATGAAAEQLASLGNKLKELPLVALNGQAATLYGDIDSADGAPSPAQRAAVAKLTQDYPKALERWNELVKELKAANITVTTKPVHRDDDDDSDDDIG
jgi:hypothetical protein